MKNKLFLGAVAVTQSLLFTALIFFSFALRLNSATCVSTGNGLWTNAGTWSCGHAPTCNDSVVVQSGHQVTVTTVNDLRSCGGPLVIAIYGTLKYNTAGRLRLACNSRVYIFGGGSLVPLGDGGGSNELEICGQRQWRASDGTVNGPVCFPATLTSCAAVLPVEVIIFERQLCDENSVCLKWETASERNNDYFQVDRSVDGTNFSLVQIVKSKALNGNSTSKLSYEIKDENSVEGISYYRLKQIDFDGTSSQMPLIAVNANRVKQLSFSLYPNPNNGNFKIYLSASPFNRLTQIVLKDFKGKPIFKEAHYLERVSNEINLNLQGKVPAGVYFCSVFVDEVEYTVKLMIN